MYDASTASLLPTPAGNASAAESILLGDGYVKAANGNLEKNGKPLLLTLLGQQPELASGLEYLASQFNAMGITTTIADVDAVTSATDLKTGKWNVAASPESYSIPAMWSQYSAWSGVFPISVGVNSTQSNDPLLIADIKAAQSSTGCQSWDDFQAQLISGYHMLPLAATRVDWFSAGLDAVIPFGEDLDFE